LKGTRSLGRFVVKQAHRYSLKTDKLGYAFLYELQNLNIKALALRLLKEYCLPHEERQLQLF